MLKRKYQKFQKVVNYFLDSSLFIWMIAKNSEKLYYQIKKDFVQNEILKISVNVMTNMLQLFGMSLKYYHDL